MPIADIRAAIDAELAATPEFYDFKVLRTAADGALWRVTLEPDYVYAEGQRPGQASAQTLLDERLEGASAWWGAPAKGGASVLGVVVEDDQLVLKDASGPPPGEGHLIRIYPPRFLKAVADAWSDDGWAARAAASWPGLAAPRAVADAPVLDGSPFRWLRAAQREALSLIGVDNAFLWGPPGTGKTTTLGVLLAEYLDRKPDARVLLLSTTNHAVDLATLAVDKALQKGRREALRASVQRLGSRFDAEAYAGRGHLLPPAGTPSSQALRHCRLATMTTTRAAFTLKSLREVGESDEHDGRQARLDRPCHLDGDEFREIGGRGDAPFDLIVFDEASQVSLAHALALMPLGRARLFAGDPQQLSPVLRSEDRLAKIWLGRSPFAAMPRGAPSEGTAPSVAMLDEQSRMAAPIGELVSDLFYDGALRVAADAVASAEWGRARARALGDIPADVHVKVHRVTREGGWSAKDRGPVRRESADAIAATVAQALASGEWAPHELIVLTPFRAQRALIRWRLDALGVDARVKVSTVHRAQGSEAPVVFFDPADGTQPFLRTEEARRLLNVALSRAQAKVVIYLSSADLTNEVLAPIVQRMRLAGDAREAVPLAALAKAADFPFNAKGLRVAAGRLVGEVDRVAPDGARLWVINEKSGNEVELDAEFWRRK
ncbi:ATP-binding protein [Mitsuaria sp. GD03876]|uniref:DEAD/DEAH box helicase n=1 Tax=Mitsuaria sp. GD03876 TaxID=2975399 RepID=UPI00244C486C|nr:ATP-binding protein [Mitsuaria sp. GD03876]MDH0864666.1 ATP-binding protein [Mitsuaria sp. GD03876]